MVVGFERIRSCVNQVHGYKLRLSISGIQEVLLNFLAGLRSAYCISISNENGIWFKFLSL